MGLIFAGKILCIFRLTAFCKAADKSSTTTSFTGSKEDQNKAMKVSKTRYGILRAEKEKLIFFPDNVRRLLSAEKVISGRLSCGRHPSDYPYDWSLRRTNFLTIRILFMIFQKFFYKINFKKMKYFMIGNF